MSKTEALDSRLNQMIAEGRFMEAFEAFYDDDVEMQENNNPPTVGKPANRKLHEEFIDGLQAFHEATLINRAINGDVSFTEWLYDLTMRDAGRVRSREVAVRVWKHGKVSRERFYYDDPSSKAD
jgi:ketosteroid isomerase-like protein